MFLWVTLPRFVDAGELLAMAIEAKVAFVTGRAFHCDGSGANTLRLNFSHPSIERIELAIERLARCIESMLRQARPAVEANVRQIPLLVGDAS